MAAVDGLELKALTHVRMHRYHLDISVVAFDKATVPLKQTPGEVWVVWKKVEKTDLKTARVLCGMPSGA
jgi:hypothetical protein